LDFVAKGRMKLSKLKTFCFAAAAFILAFTTLEIGLRLFNAAEVRPLYTAEGVVPDPYRFWKLPGKIVKFKPDQCKVLCLADSVTVMNAGRGYPDLLARKVMERGGPAVSVFNGGVPEYSSYQGRVYLERELARYKPDVVVIHFGWNDHWESPNRMTDASRGSTSTALEKIYSAAGHFRIFRWIQRTLALRRPSMVRVPPEDYLANLSSMAKFASSWGGRPIMVTAPALQREEQWAPIHLRYQEITREAATQSGALLLDLADSFGQKPEMYLNPATDPCHFSALGEDLTASLLADLIVIHGLCKEK